MLKNSVKILVFLFVLISLQGCQNKMIPAGYLPRPRDADKVITGSWIDVNTATFKISGELIAIQSDSVYVLTDVGFNALHKRTITSAVLYLFTPQGGKGPLRRL